jgi:hypothetical protein
VLQHCALPFTKILEILCVVHASICTHTHGYARCHLSFVKCISLCHHKRWLRNNMLTQWLRMVYLLGVARIMLLQYSMDWIKAAVPIVKMKSVYSQNWHSSFITCHWTPMQVTVWCIIHKLYSRYFLVSQFSIGLWQTLHWNRLWNFLFIHQFSRRWRSCL